MCGIFGAVLRGNATRSDLRVIGESACRLLHHRGPDAEAHWLDEPRGVLLVHTRLSVLDLSAAGAQPMATRSGRYVVVFNGEIYNHQALRLELGLDPAAWRGHSDTETLLEAIERWGVEPTLQRLDGMFAFGLWDRDAQMLTLVRDRLGEKPLYWANGSWGAAFSSEMRALRLLPQIDCSIDAESVGSLLRWGFIAHPRTICAGVRQLAPGTIVTVRADGSVEEHPVSQLLPPSTAVKAKMGFDPPLGEWLRGPLRRWAEDLLFGPELQPWLDRAAIDACWHGHLDRRRNNEYRLWAAITLAAWCRTNASPVATVS